jgi:hypothetical protein
MLERRRQREPVRRCVRRLRALDTLRVPNALRVPIARVGAKAGSIAMSWRSFWTTDRRLTNSLHKHSSLVHLLML